MNTFTQDDIVLLLSDVGLHGYQTATVELGPGERAWNPVRNDTLLRGPARVTYVLWADGGWDATVRPAVRA